MPAFESNVYVSSSSLATGTIPIGLQHNAPMITGAETATVPRTIPEMIPMFVLDFSESLFVFSAFP